MIHEQVSNNHHHRTRVIGEEALVGGRVEPSGEGARLRAADGGVHAPHAALRAQRALHPRAQRGWTVQVLVLEQLLLQAEALVVKQLSS